MRLNIFMEQLKLIEESIIKTGNELKDYEVHIDIRSYNSSNLKKITIDNEYKFVIISNYE